MKTIIALLLTLTLTVPAFAQTSAGDKPLAREKWIRVDIQASVENINKEKREITLKGPQGNLVTLTATEAVERFDEIKVGDRIQAESWPFLRAEFREPTAEEQTTPLVVLAEAGRALRRWIPLVLWEPSLKPSSRSSASIRKGKRSPSRVREGTL